MEKLHNDILKLLSEDSRFTPAHIAKMLGASEAGVKKAIDEMEKQGVIIRYGAVINYDKISDERVEALIEVRVSPQASHGFDTIAKEICSLEMVDSVYLMSGAYDLAVIVSGKSLKTVAMFVSEKLSAMNCVLSTATHFILKKYKLDGVMLEKEDVKRMALFV